MARNEKMEIDNSGINQGIMVANNTGNIYVTLNETKKNSIINFYRCKITCVCL